MKMKKLAAAIAVAVPVGSMLIFAAEPASASATCTANLCAGPTSISGNVATIHAWARDTTFLGHFQLQTPNGRTLNSIESTWNAGGTGNYFNNINGGVGTWCVTEYVRDPYVEPSPSWHKDGYICFSA